MSNSSQQMTRWTEPKNAAFYSLHKNAIGLYHTASVIVQLIWLVFSTRPLAQMVIDALPQAEPYAYVMAVVALAFLHYMIHELTRYVFFNWLDNDPNTNSSFGSIATLTVIVLGMLALDIQGVTSFIRDENKFTTLHTQNETLGSAAAQKRISIFNADLATINGAFNADFEAIKTQYAAKIAKAQRVKTFDGEDLRRKNITISNIKTERDNALAIKKTELATAQRNLVEAKNTDLAGIDKKHNAITGKIENADGENQAKAHSYGWIVSLFCLIALIFATYQSTVLRVMSGQQPVSRYTIADATGSTTTKLFDVLTDAYQRQTHRFLVAFHAVLTTGTQELDELDGAFNLKKKNATAIATTPPAKGGGTEGGDGGSDSPKPIVPPAPAQPLGGKSVLTGKYFKDIHPQTAFKIAENFALKNDLSVSGVLKAMKEINPFFSLEKGFWEIDEKMIPLIISSTNMFTPTPTLELVDNTIKSVITDITPVITAEETKAEIDNKKLLTAFKAGIQDLNSECRNYETKNGSIETIANRIAEKVVTLYNFSQEQKDIIPENVFANFTKAYHRARGIIEDFKAKEVNNG